jgi:hypothetical protein
MSILYYSLLIVVVLSSILWGGVCAKLIISLTDF